jgi:hypothetical protein
MWLCSYFSGRAQEGHHSSGGGIGGIVVSNRWCALTCVGRFCRENASRSRDRGGHPAGSRIARAREMVWTRIGGEHDDRSLARLRITAEQSAQAVTVNERESRLGHEDRGGCGSSPHQGFPAVCRFFNVKRRHSQSLPVDDPSVIVRVDEQHEHVVTSGRL